MGVQSLRPLAQIEANMLIVVISYGLMGLLLVGLSIPLIGNRVKPNIWYGFRIRATLDNPNVWYPVNAWAGRRTCVAGVVTFVAALVGLLVPERLLAWYSLALAIVLIAGVSLILVFGIRYARRLAREPDQPPRW